MLCIFSGTVSGAGDLCSTDDSILALVCLNNGISGLEGIYLRN